eukprot:RCo046143
MAQTGRPLELLFGAPVYIRQKTHTLAVDVVSRIAMHCLVKAGLVLLIALLYALSSLRNVHGLDPIFEVYLAFRTAMQNLIPGLAFVDTWFQETLREGLPPYVRCPTLTDVCALITISLASYIALRRFIANVTSAGFWGFSPFRKPALTEALFEEIGLSWVSALRMRDCGPTFAEQFPRVSDLPCDTYDLSSLFHKWGVDPRFARVYQHALEGDYYDLIVVMDGLQRDLNSSALGKRGFWPVLFSDSFRQLMEKNENRHIVSAIGPWSAGKTFLINLISGTRLDSREDPATDALSLKLVKNAKYAFLDTAGSQTPATILPGQERHLPLFDRAAANALVSSVAFSLSRVLIFVFDRMTLSVQMEVEQLLQRARQGQHLSLMFIIVLNFRHSTYEKAKFDELFRRHITSFVQTGTRVDDANSGVSYWDDRVSASNVVSLNFTVRYCLLFDNRTSAGYNRRCANLVAGWINSETLDNIPGTSLFARLENELQAQLPIYLEVLGDGPASAPTVGLDVEKGARWGFFLRENRRIRLKPGYTSALLQDPRIHGNYLPYSLRAQRDERICKFKLMADLSGWSGRLQRTPGPGLPHFELRSNGPTTSDIASCTSSACADDPTMDPHHTSAPPSGSATLRVFFQPDENNIVLHIQGERAAPSIEGFDPIGYFGREERRQVAARVVVPYGLLETESYPTMASLEDGVLMVSYSTPA